MKKKILYYIYVILLQILCIKFTRLILGNCTFNRHCLHLRHRISRQKNTICKLFIFWSRVQKSISLLICNRFINYIGLCKQLKIPFKQPFLNLKSIIGNVSLPYPDRKYFDFKCDRIYTIIWPR